MANPKRDAPVKAESKAGPGTLEPRTAPAKPALESFYRVRRLDRFNYVIERVDLESGAVKAVQACKPDVRRIVLSKLQAFLCG